MILHFNEKSFELTIKCKPTETFTPSRGVSKLAKEGRALKVEHDLLQEKYVAFLQRCTKWNRKHNKELDKMLKKTEQLKEK